MKPPTSARAPERSRSSFLETHDLYARGELALALAATRTLLAKEPSSADAWNLTGLILAALGERSAACRFFQRAIRLDPSFVEAHSNLGSALCSGGNATSALAAFEQALRLRPLDPAANHNFLLACLCAPELDADALADRHRRWGASFEKGIEPLQAPRDNPGREVGRPLRLGYVSADFRRHSVAWFLEPILTHHDRDRVRVHAYSNLAEPGDDVTTRLRSLVDVWRPIAGRTDLDVARRIASDRIEVLVDLSGHTAGHRLGVFARQPAPVQISYLGYPATTGLSRMGFRLTDAWADPPGGTERFHTEELIRLPGGFLCYAPPDLPLAPESPSRRKGHVTFGSFNDLGKVSDRLLATWGRILRELPGSHLRLKGRALDDGEARARIVDTLRGHGVESTRLELDGWKSDPAEHLSRYGEVDIALDTYPYNGTTTTCEALWMGVPVVTQVGPSHVSRVGLSLLTRTGLPHLCAASEDEYVRCAVALGRDPRSRQELRAGLRDRLRGSGLMDAARFVRELEDTFYRLRDRVSTRGR